MIGYSFSNITVLSNTTENRLNKPTEFYNKTCNKYCYQNWRCRSKMLLLTKALARFDVECMNKNFERELVIFHKAGSKFKETALLLHANCFGNSKSRKAKELHTSEWETKLKKHYKKFDFNSAAMKTHLVVPIDWDASYVILQKREQSYRKLKSVHPT